MKNCESGLRKNLFCFYFLGGSDSPPRTRNCDENLTIAPVLPLSSLVLSEHTVNPSNPTTAISIISPSSASSVPVLTVKQERLSPVTVIPARELTDSPLSGPHSTTQEQSAAVTTETRVEPISLGKVSRFQNQQVTLVNSPEITHFLSCCLPQMPL